MDMRQPQVTVTAPSVVARRALSISRVLATYARSIGCTFTVDGKPEPAVFLLSPELLLPVVALHADAQARALLGHPLGVKFEADEHSLLGTRANVPPLTGDAISALRVTFFTHSATRIFGIAQNVRIECLPVLEAYRDGLLAHIERAGRIEWPMATVSPR